jgi:hypothetical protein
MEILAGEALFALFIAAHLLAVVALSLEESEKKPDHRGPMAGHAANAANR